MSFWVIDLKVIFVYINLGYKKNKKLIEHFVSRYNSYYITSCRYCPLSSKRENPSNNALHCIARIVYCFLFLLCGPL